MLRKHNVQAKGRKEGIFKLLMFSFTYLHLLIHFSHYFSCQWHLWFVRPTLLVPPHVCIDVSRLVSSGQDFSMLLRFSVKGRSYPFNRPWRPVGLWDVEAPALSGQSSQRWRWVCQPDAPATLTLLFTSVRGWVHRREVPHPCIMFFFFFLIFMVLKLPMRSVSGE
jgi:hypothetical protein